MRRLGLISTASALGLIGAGVLGTATAQSPVPSPPRTVAVQGSGHVAIDSAAGADAANGAYRQGLAAAVSDGQSKASFLAGRAGATLGAVQSVIEGGGYIDCGAGDYTGVQPDFGSGPSGVAVSSSGVASSAPAPRRTSSTPPATRKKKRRRRKAIARTASTCTLNAQVSLAYTLG